KGMRLRASACGIGRNISCVPTDILPFDPLHVHLSNSIDISLRRTWRRAKVPIVESRRCPRWLAMGFYRDRIYPQLVSALGDPAPIRDRRRQLLPEARGIVLEVGVGSGANFEHYDPARVDKIYALEPNPGMVLLAERHLRRTALTVEFLALPSERIPLPDACVDTVVSTFTLCTIRGIVDALRGVHRVMK